MPPMWYKVVKSSFQCWCPSLQHGEQKWHSSKTERSFLCITFHIFVFPGLLASHCLNGTVKRKCLFTVISGLLLCNHVEHSLSHRTAAASLSLPCVVCLVLSLSRRFFLEKIWNISKNMIALQNKSVYRIPAVDLPRDIQNPVIVIRPVNASWMFASQKNKSINKNKYFSYGLTFSVVFPDGSWI